MKIRKNFDEIYIPKLYIIMINGMNIFYSSKIGKGLELVQGKGLEPVQSKSKRGGSCNKKCNKKQFKGHGLKILK